MARFLTQHADQWLGMAASITGSTALLGGDPDKYADAEASAALLTAQIALRDGIGTIERLAKDPTRSDPQRHEAGGKVSAKTVETLAKSKATIESRIESLHASGVAEVEAAFAPNLQRSHLDAEIMRYVREQAAKPEGVTKLHDLVKTNRNVAAVIYQSESFLLGLADQTHSTLRFDAAEHHVPAAYKKMTNSLAMQELPGKLDGAIANVKRGFHSQAIAAQTALRVDIA